jgi:hypothetical protein
MACIVLLEVEIMLNRQLFLLTFCLSWAAFGQDSGRNTISVGVGGGFPTGGDLTFTSPLPTSAAFSASYEFRLFRYFAPEVSVVNLIPKYITNYDPNQGPPIPERYRVTLFSFGGRAIAPLRQGRIELFAGAAAVHVSSSNSELFFYNSPHWIGQLNGGGRIAIDKGRHFWIGPTVRFSRDGGRPTQEWVSLTGDLGFRF